MSDLFELQSPNGNFTVKVDAERRGVLLGRGYHDVGTTATGWQAGQTAEVVEHAARKPAAKPVPKAAPKPRGRPKKAR